MVPLAGRVFRAENWSGHLPTPDLTFRTSLRAATPGWGGVIIPPAGLQTAEATGLLPRPRNDDRPRR